MILLAVLCGMIMPALNSLAGNEPSIYHQHDDYLCIYETASYNDAVNDAVQVLKTMVTIKELQISSNRGDEILIEGIQAGFCKQLKTLVFAGLLSAKHLESLMSNLPELNALYFYQRVNADAIDGLVAAVKAGYGKFLRAVWLDNGNVSAIQVQSIVENCKELKEILLSGSASVAGLVSVVQAGYGKDLQDICLQCTDCSAMDIQVIMKNCPNLNEFSLYECQAGIAGLLMALHACYGKQLKEINIFELKPTAQELDALKQALPSQCKIVA